MTTTGTDISSRVLVLGLVRTDGTLPASELYSVAGAVGLTTEQVRLATRRLIAQGALTQEGRGRGALLTATSPTSPLRVEQSLLAYAYLQDTGRAPWDGHWHIATFSVPERRRAQRDGLRRTLRFYGGAPIGGIYVSPNPWEPFLQPALDELGVRDAVTLATAGELDVGGERDPRRLAAQLWPLDTLEAGYRDLATTMREARDSARRQDDRVDLLATTFGAIVAFATAAEYDPFLPPQLLPKRWSGTRARTLLAEILDVVGQRLPRNEQPVIIRALAPPAR